MTASELIAELDNSLFKDRTYIAGGYILLTPEMIADFILADRLRVVEPLVKFCNNPLSKATVHSLATEMICVIKETINNAGVSL